MSLKVFNNWHRSLALAASSEWPNSVWPHWHFYCNKNALKYTTKDPDRLTPTSKLLINLLATSVPEFMSVVSNRLQTWDDSVFPDLNLYGAGMHWVPQEGYLGEHQDSEVHPVMGWKRKINTVLFLSECVGGELVVRGQEPIEPEPGKIVVFEPSLPHSVNRVISGDRKTLSLFWWSETNKKQGRSKAEFADVLYD